MYRFSITLVLLVLWSSESRCQMEIPFQIVPQMSAFMLSPGNYPLLSGQSSDMFPISVPLKKVEESKPPGATVFLSPTGIDYSQVNPLIEEEKKKIQEVIQDFQAHPDKMPEVIQKKFVEPNAEALGQIFNGSQINPNSVAGKFMNTNFKIGPGGNGPVSDALYEALIESWRTMMKAAPAGTPTLDPLVIDHPMSVSQPLPFNELDFTITRVIITGISRFRRESLTILPTKREIEFVIRCDEVAADSRYKISTRIADNTITVPLGRGRLYTKLEGLRIRCKFDAFPEVGKFQNLEEMPSIKMAKVKVDTTVDSIGLRFLQGPLGNSPFIKNIVLNNAYEVFEMMKPKISDMFSLSFSKSLELKADGKFFGLPLMQPNF